MPFYDRACSACAWTQIDAFERVTCPAPPCPDCGAETTRVWLSKPPNVIGDECDIIQENGFRHPRRFRFKSDRRRALKEAGCQEAVRHVGAKGSDRSKHTINWGARMDAKTLENALALVSRASTTWSEPPLPPVNMHITIVRGEGIG